MKKETDKLLTGASTSLVIIMFVMLFVYITNAEELGGSAEKGYISDGKYYVYNEDTDDYIEVTKDGWETNIIIHWFTMGAMILGCIGLLYFMFKIIRMKWRGESYWD